MDSMNRATVPALIIVACALLFLVATAWISTPTSLVVKYLAPNVVVIQSSTGGDAVLPLAVPSSGTAPGAAGLMTSEQARLLDDLAREVDDLAREVDDLAREEPAPDGPIE